MLGMLKSDLVHEGRIKLRLKLYFKNEFRLHPVRKFMLPCCECDERFEEIYFNILIDQ